MRDMIELHVKTVKRSHKKRKKSAEFVEFIFEGDLEERKYYLCVCTYCKYEFKAKLTEWQASPKIVNTYVLCPNCKLDSLFREKVDSHDA